MSDWMKEWGQFIVLLVAMAGLHGWGFSVLRSDMARVESSLESQIVENRRAINALGREVSELRGELKGRDLIVGEDDR